MKEREKNITIIFTAMPATVSLRFPGAPCTKRSSFHQVLLQSVIKYFFLESARPVGEPENSQIQVESLEIAGY
jgi:hypothetical protein